MTLRKSSKVVVPKREDSMASFRKFSAISIGSIALISNVLTIVMFLSDKQYLNFWQPSWIISLLIIVLLFFIAFGLFALGSMEEETRDFILLLFGFCYLIASYALYVIWGYKHTAGTLNPSSYIGYATLFAICSSISIFSYLISKKKAKALIWPSFGYGLVSIVFIWFLIKKYVLNPPLFNEDIFLAEIIVLIVGSGLFIILFIASDN